MPNTANKFQTAVFDTRRHRHSAKNIGVSSSEQDQHLGRTYRSHEAGHHGSRSVLDGSAFKRRPLRSVSVRLGSQYRFRSMILLRALFLLL